MDGPGLPRYVCSRCGTCCRWPGYVRLTADETDCIAAYLGLDVREFIEQYTHITADRRCLSLIEVPTGACVMLTADNLCRINPVKPTQCRTFPERWRFPGFETRCRARRLD